MATIEVRTQAELDAALKAAKPTDIIAIRGSGYFDLYDSSTVTAYGSSTVRAYGSSTVTAYGSSTVGTRYDLTDREPFVAFDIMRGPERLTHDEFTARTERDFYLPTLLADRPTSIEDALSALGTYGHYGALDRVEGVVWRVERKGKVDFLCKYVRPDKVDGSYLDSVTGREPVWNWQPEPAS